MLNPAGAARMSLMFGRPRTCSAVSGLDRALPECNIAVLGVTGSGKSALTVKFLTKRFISEYDPNLEDTYSSEELVDQQPVLLKVMDTADQDGAANCERYLSWAGAFLVVYSIEDRHSFEGCQQYLDIVTQHTRSLAVEPPVILLGNKLDMERYRQVSPSEGSALASRYGCLFSEVSACKDFLQVQQVFHELVRETRREAEKSLAARTLYISEDRPASASPTTPTLVPGLRELPSPTTAKVVTVKASRAQNKRRAPTLTLLKGFRIF